MIHSTLDSIALTLWRAAIEGGVLALVVGALVRVFPRLPASTRTALWWFVSLRFVAGLIALPLLLVPVPQLPAPPAALVQTTLRAFGPLPGVVHDAVLGAGDVAAVPVRPQERAFGWRDAARLVRPVVGSALPWLLLVWAAGMLIVLVRHVRGCRRLWRMWGDASTTEDPRLASWASLAGCASLEVRVSPDVASPMLLAGRRARILLPASCLTLDPTRLQLVLAHEAAHLRRHDLTLGLVPAFAQWVFWFHPLARWACEEYAQAREEACDADAIRACDAQPYDYGELLLAYGIEPARPVPAAACYGSRSASRLHRRILMLAHGRQHDRFERRIAVVVLLLVAAGALSPVRLVAADARSEGATAVAAGSTSSAPRLGALAAIGDGAGRARSKRSSRGNGFEYGTGRLADHGQGLNMSMSGRFDSNAMTWFKSVAKTHPDGFGWFKVQGVRYLVTDPQAIAEMRDILAPQDELGELQGALGERQGKLGEEQGRLGEMQGDLGERQGELAGKLSEIEALLAQERMSPSRREQLREKRAATERLLEELEEKQRELERKQDELGRLQDELGDEQDALGARQDEISAQINRDMLALANDLIQRGLAVRTDRR